MRGFVLPMLLSVVLIGAAMAGQGKDDPSGVVRSFHEALATGDRTRALALLDPGVVIFEQGGAEMSRDEYTSEHLDADIEFSKATTSKEIEHRVRVVGKSAWVLTISETTGNFRGKEVASRNAESMVLQKTAGGWRIMHVHWSSHHQN